MSGNQVTAVPWPEFKEGDEADWHPDFRFKEARVADMHSLVEMRLIDYERARECVNNYDMILTALKDAVEELQHHSGSSDCSVMNKDENLDGYLVVLTHCGVKL